MTAAGWGQLLALIVLILVTAPLLGRYMANVYEGTPSRARSVVRARSSGSSTASAASTPSASSAGTSTRCRCWRSASCAFFFVYLIQRVQSESAVQPDRRACNVHPALAFNTAVSFMTNTNWQTLLPGDHGQPPHPGARPHRPELRLGRGGHGGHGRVDPRASPGPAPRPSATSGSTSCAVTLRILLPLALLFAVIFLVGGVIQNLSGFDDVKTVDRHGAGDPRRAGGQPGGHQAARHRTAVGSSTPTRRRRSRTPRRSATSSRRTRSCSSRSRWRSRSVTW